jgi:cytochrome c-type biogenesis protein CcmH
VHVKRWPWIALAVVVAVAVIVLVAGSGQSEAPEARAQRLERELACPVCNGESVAESHAPESRAIRAGIRERIADGKSDREIRDSYVEAYGERILLTPDSGGLGVIAWGVPVVLLVLGAGGIALALRRWSRTPRLAATAADEEIVARAREDES